MHIVLSYATEFDYHEGHQIARALRALGHHVEVVNVAVDDATRWWPETKTFAPDVSLDQVAPSKTDLFLYIESRGLLPRGLETARCHTACILSDTMHALEPRLDLSRLFDDVLLYHRHALDLLPQSRDRVHWVPHGIDPTMFNEAGATRDLDVAFVGRSAGTWASRRALLEAIASRYRTNDFFTERVPFAELAQLYRRAKIVVNTPVLDTLNPRIFEAMGCGALLLTQRVNNGIETFFEEGIHFVGFDNEDEALAQIDYYLAHDDDRARIARAGHDETHRAHTYAHRFTGVIEKLVASAPHAALARTLPRAEVDAIYIRRHKQAGEVGALMRQGALWSAGKTIAARLVGHEDTKMTNVRRSRRHDTHEARKL